MAVKRSCFIHLLLLTRTNIHKKFKIPKLAGTKHKYQAIMSSCRLPAVDDFGNQLLKS